jgi:hypothetical protein
MATNGRKVKSGRGAPAESDAVATTDAHERDVDSRNEIEMERLLGSVKIATGCRTTCASS